MTAARIDVDAAIALWEAAGRDPDPGAHIAAFAHPRHPSSVPVIARAVEAADLRAQPDEATLSYTADLLRLR